MMKALIIVILIIAIAGAWFFLRPRDEDLLADPDIKKFAVINSELAIEFERVEQDSLLFVPVRDSIYECFNVTEDWIGEITARINKHPEKWEDVYDLMIKHAELIKDSLLHKTRIPGDSTLPDSLS